MIPWIELAFGKQPCNNFFSGLLLLGFITLRANSSPHLLVFFVSPKRRTATAHHRSTRRRASVTNSIHELSQKDVTSSIIIINKPSRRQVEERRKDDETSDGNNIDSELKIDIGCVATTRTRLIASSRLLLVDTPTSNRSKPLIPSQETTSTIDRP